MKDINKLLAWLASGEASGFPGRVEMCSLEAAQRLAWHVFRIDRYADGYDPRYRKWYRLSCRLDRCERAVARAWRAHERWLQGGCPPMGTRDRARIDALREARWRLVGRRNAALRDSVIRACADHLGWV